MAKTPKLYTRLTRNAAGLGSYSSLWLGPDHLLIVRSTGYHETYSRIQLRDIKGIFVLTGSRRVAGGRRVFWGLLWGIIAAISGFVMVASFVQRVTPIFSVIFFVLGTGALIWNQLLGAGCRAYVVTGVQTAVLPSLVRIKKTRRVLDRIEPLIAAAQADLVTAPTAPSAPAPLNPAPPPPV